MLGVGVNRDGQSFTELIYQDSRPKTKREDDAKEPVGIQLARGVHSGDLESILFRCEPSLSQVWSKKQDRPNAWKYAGTGREVSSYTRGFKG